MIPQLYTQAGQGYAPAMLNRATETRVDKILISVRSNFRSELWDLPVRMQGVQQPTLNDLTDVYSQFKPAVIDQIFGTSANMTPVSTGRKVCQLESTLLPTSTNYLVCSPTREFHRLVKSLTIESTVWYRHFTQLCEQAIMENGVSADYCVNVNLEEVKPTYREQLVLPTKIVEKVEAGNRSLAIANPAQSKVQTLDLAQTPCRVPQTLPTYKIEFNAKLIFA